MAGHSKWANIRHRKGAQDARRGKIFTKLIKEIAVAVKNGGPDPETNPRLRLAVQNARGQNMPRDNVERAIKKASGQGGEDYLELTYEGYGPDGVAVFVECQTDNNTRTVANVRSYFNKSGGSLGKDGCLQFIFERKGIFVLEVESIPDFDEDEFILSLIDAGAEDVERDQDLITITSAMEDFGVIQSYLAERDLSPKEAGLRRIPVTTKELKAENVPAFLKLVDALEDDDDVQNIYHNWEVDESMLN